MQPQIQSEKCFRKACPRFAREREAPFSARRYCEMINEQELCKENSRFIDLGNTSACICVLARRMVSFDWET